MSDELVEFTAESGEVVRARVRAVLPNLFGPATFLLLLADNRYLEIECNRCEAVDPESYD